MATEKSLLSTEDACRIIETSAKAGVTELKFGDLHVRFGRPVEQIVGMSFAPYPVQQAPQSSPVNDLTENQHQTQNKDNLEAEEVKTREERLARALIEDPELYERLMRDGDLTDDAADSDADNEE